MHIEVHILMLFHYIFACIFRRKQFIKILSLVIRIDMILAEIKLNLSPFKVFHFLINNIKSKHKLTDLNYNRLAILSRIVQIVGFDGGLLIALVIANGLNVLIAILSQNWIWIFISIYYVPTIIIGVATFSNWMCIVFTLFTYYKMRFDQIHSSIKSISSNYRWFVINKRI